MHRVEQIRGMPIVVEVRDGDAPLDEVFDWFRRVDDTFSTYKPDSEISRVARGESPASPEVRAILDRCEQLRVQTNGYFDAYAGGTLDPSGLVKGWAVDRAAAILERAGLTDFSIAAGGDVVVRGGALPEPTWRVGIQHPRDRAAIALAIELSDAAVATSGAYERGEHILDPRTGAPPSGVLSVTVLGPELGLADAYSTAAFALGLDGPRWTLGLDGYEAMTVLDGDQVLFTPGFPE
jgi:thiamine biosynthesis lipoprotein